VIGLDLAGSSCAEEKKTPKDRWMKSSPVDLGPTTLDLAPWREATRATPRAATEIKIYLSLMFLILCAII
jgi:hypothetical protein